MAAGHMQSADRIVNWSGSHSTGASSALRNWPVCRTGNQQELTTAHMRRTCTDTDVYVLPGWTGRACRVLCSTSRFTCTVSQTAPRSCVFWTTHSHCHTIVRTQMSTPAHTHESCTCAGVDICVHDTFTHNNAIILRCPLPVAPYYRTRSGVYSTDKVGRQFRVKVNVGERLEDYARNIEQVKPGRQHRGHLRDSIGKLCLKVIIIIVME